MGTPICDFVRRYAAENPTRLHMPGHKGKGCLGVEALDITEIDGADDLFAPRGIIAESEENAARLFGARTLYSAGGSTLCIQAMLYLTALSAAESGKTPCILAGRNAHKAFVHAAALLHIAVRWIYPDETQPYYSGKIAAADVAALCDAELPTAVYITTPDYLGNTVDVEAIAAVCHARGVPLLVDNAHGAYLRFLPQSRHPLDLGADMCCDSAHKTLPVLTGGAYLHIADAAPTVFHERVIEAMALFGSSSPSYLILQSLDAANDRLPDFAAALAKFLPQAAALREKLAAAGFETVGDEPLKLTVNARSRGYSGESLAAVLRENRVFPEFYDADFLVLMLAPFDTEVLARIEALLCALPQGTETAALRLPLSHPTAVMQPHEALFLPTETLPLDACLDRVCGMAVIACPPAVPPVMCGERMDAAVLAQLRYYGVERCTVIR